MQLKVSFSIAAGIISLIGGLPYIRSVLRLKTKPAKASWLIWTLLDIITIFGMYIKGASINGQLIIGSTNALIIAILSLKYGESGWKKRDKRCLMGAFGGIVLWKLFNDPIFAITISLGIMFAGAIPTLFDAWDDPTRENKLAWTLFAISSICGLIATPNLELKNIAQPITFFIINSSIASVLYLRKPTPP